MRYFAVLAMLVPLFSHPSAAVAAGCAAQKKTPAQITVELELPEPVYNLRQSIREINAEKNAVAENWIESNGLQKIWKSSDMMMLGYAEGGMAMVASSKFKIEKYDMYGVYYCPYVTHFDVSMIFRTRIVIPKNFKRGGCRFNAVQSHEYRHYKANRDVAEEFVKQLYKDLPVIIGEIENRHPYVEGKDVAQKIKAMQQALKDAVESYILLSMTDEAKRRNGEIDSPEEYAAAGPIMAACKD